MMRVQHWNADYNNINTILRSEAALDPNRVDDADIVDVLQQLLKPPRARRSRPASHCAGNARNSHQ